MKKITREMNNAAVLTALFVTLALAVSPDTAFAQGQGTALLEYTILEYGKPMMNMAVAALGIFMFFLRFSLPVVGTVAAGGLTFANYEEIAGLFGG